MIDHITHFYVCPRRVAVAALHTNVVGRYDAPGGSEGREDSVLLQIDWRTAQWHDRERFEADPDVLALGEPWDLLPPAAVKFLETMRPGAIAARKDHLGGVPPKARPPQHQPDKPVDGTHTVIQALRKVVPHLL